MKNTVFACALLIAGAIVTTADGDLPIVGLCMMGAALLIFSFPYIVFAFRKWYSSDDATKETKNQ